MNKYLSGGLHIAKYLALTLLGVYLYNVAKLYQTPMTGKDRVFPERLFEAMGEALVIILGYLFLAYHRITDL